MGSLRVCPVAHARRGLYNTRCCRRRRVRQRSLHAGKLEDRAAPYTVPIKAVPPQCGALGRVRPAPLAAPRGADGTRRPSVPVRALSRPSAAVQSLRSWPALLQRGVFTPGTRECATRSRTTLPAQPPRSHGPRRTGTAMAKPPPRRRKNGDASGFPSVPRRCSTGRMHGHHYRQRRGAAARTRGGRRMCWRDASAGGGCRCTVSALRSGVDALGASGLPAPGPAGRYSHHAP